MYAHLPHLTTLEDFALGFNLDPWHMAGFCCDEEQTDSACGCACGSAWLEAGGNSVSRQDVSQALWEAEDDLANWLGFSVAPRQYENLPVEILGGGFYQRGGKAKTLTLPYAYPALFGLRTLTLIGSATLTAPGSFDNKRAMFTVSRTVPSGTAAASVKLYFIEADRGGLPLEGFEVRPFSAIVSGTTYTAKVPAYLLAQPDIAMVEDECLDRNELTSYVSDLDAYLESVLPCSHGYAIGKSAGADCGGVPCQDVTQSICLGFTGKPSTITITPSSCTGGVFAPVRCLSMEPYTTVINLVAGYPLTPQGRINPSLLQAVIRLAASKLVCEFPSCDCKTCRYKALEKLRRVPVYKSSEGEDGEAGDSYNILVTEKQLEKVPFGALAGAIDAWRKVKSMRILQ